MGTPCRSPVGNYSCVVKLPPKLKKPLKVAVGLLILLLVMALGDHLWCLRKLSGKAFVAQAEDITMIHSIRWTRYIGTSGGRVYLEFIPLGRSRPIVYWTNLSELPPDLAARLEAGEVPWESPMKRNARERR